ncbi:MAG: hypothetical protein IJ176_06090 [Prevotella sp.]|nr:hypothetical protein [Prevotella sp.]
MKRHYFILAGLIGALALGACSTEEDEAAYVNPAVNSSDAVSGDGVKYAGRWSFTSFSASADQAAALSQAADMGADEVVLNMANYEMQVGKAPVDLFLMLAGLADGEVKEQPPFKMTLQEKGYSQTTLLYGVVVPDYVLTVAQGSTTHELSVAFKDINEVSLNSYLGTMSLMLHLTDIYVDGQRIKDSNAGHLMLNAERIK